MCVEWTKSKDACGYGRAWFDGKPLGAHRLAYCQAHGLKPADIAGQVVRHTCDNPACINPEHLVLGSHADNMRDMRDRFRGRSGNARKLSDEDVRAIRRLFVQYPRGGKGPFPNGGADLARRFGVKVGTVQQIIKGTAYREVM